MVVDAGMKTKHIWLGTFIYLIFEIIIDELWLDLSDLIRFRIVPFGELLREIARMMC